MKITAKGNTDEQGCVLFHFPFLHCRQEFLPRINKKDIIVCLVRKGTD